MQRITYGATSIDTTNEIAGLVYDLHAVSMEIRTAMQITVPGYMPDTEDLTALTTVLLPDTTLTALVVPERPAPYGADEAIAEMREQLRNLILESAAVEARFGLKYAR